MKENQVNENIIGAIFKISRILRQQMSSCSKVSHLSMLQLEILTYLKLTKKAKMQEITNQFHINKSTTSTHFDNLNKMKLLKRQIDGKDRRVIYLLLTKKGQTLLTEGLKYKNKRMNQLLKLLSIRDKQILLSILTNLVDLVENSYEK